MEEVWGHCAINCPGRCALRFQVEGGKVTSTDTYPAPIANGAADYAQPHPRACLRGLRMGAWMNDPARLRYPLRRVGKRGEGRFERMSWDDALDMACNELKRVVETYGNEALYLAYGTGVSATTARPFKRLFNLLGGYLESYNEYSNAQICRATSYMFGDETLQGSSLSTAAYADLILVFGSSVAETRQGGLSSQLVWADVCKACSQAHGKVIFIDCRLSDSTANAQGGQWLCINPGTDAALIAGVAHWLITHDAIDLDFLHSFCIGFDEQSMPEGYRGRGLSYRSYVMGEGYDYVAKTPEWAARISGIPERRIEQLAYEVAAAQRLFVLQGWGPQRRSNGEWTSWAVMTLPCLVGQVGLRGTNVGLRERAEALVPHGLPAPKNPVGVSIPSFLYTDAIAHPQTMTARNAGVRGKDALSCGIKYLVSYAGNCLTNQHGNANRAHHILADETLCEFILGIDVMPTDSMRYADVVLPDLFRAEQLSQVSAVSSKWAYVVSGRPCATQRFERKSAYEMATLMARRLGVEQAFTENLSEEGWMRRIWEDARRTHDFLPTWDKAFEQGVCVFEFEEHVALARFREDPRNHALNTPSGKIELFSARMLEDTHTWTISPDETITQAENLPAIGAYVPEWRGSQTNDARWPLMLSGFHYTGRIHSSWGTDVELARLWPQQLWINPADAQTRDIRDGDVVCVSNEFGCVEIAAKVTPRVIPGVVAMPQGAWRQTDAMTREAEGTTTGIDTGGCINSLTMSRPSPLAKGNPQHTNLCQVAKARFASAPRPPVKASQPGEGHAAKHEHASCQTRPTARERKQAASTPPSDRLSPGSGCPACATARLVFDAQRCTGCKTCLVACASHHKTSHLRIEERISGKTQRDEAGLLSTNCVLSFALESCIQCKQTRCASACPTGAIVRDSQANTTRIEGQTCVRCGRCAQACPASAPRQASPEAPYSKCDGCYDKLALGGVPACVSACPARALSWRTIDAPSTHVRHAR